MAEGISVSGLNKSNFTLVDFGRALHSANNFSCLAFQLGKGVAMGASVTSLGSTQWWEIFLVCCFHFTFDLFLWPLSVNLLATIWQAQIGRRRLQP